MDVERVEQTRGRVVGMYGNSVEKLVDAIIMAHSGNGVQVFRKTREYWLANFPLGRKLPVEVYDQIIYRIQDYISKNFHGAGCRCFPGSLGENGHSEALKKYVRQAFE